MAKRSVLLSALVYGLLITSVLGEDSDSCSWWAIGAGVLAAGGAIMAAPVVLTAVGFTSGGVAFGSIAAGLQGSAVASGSAFALAQSAGAAGIGLGTNVAIGSVAGVGAYKGYKTVNGCDGPKCD